MRESNLLQLFRNCNETPLSHVKIPCPSRLELWFEPAERAGSSA
jgi:hypothetical protein